MKRVTPQEKVTQKSVCLTKALWERVEAEADRAGMTQGNLLRAILTMYFQEIDSQEKEG